MISSRILARISESMMWPETSTTSVALMTAEGYSGRAGWPRVFGGPDRNPGDRNPGDRGLVDADGGDVLEPLPALVPQVADHDLDGAGGGDGQEGADEAGQFHPDEHGQQHPQRVEVDGAAHDHRL